MLNQLETLEREDRAHRQKSLSKMPVSCMCGVFYKLLTKTIMST